MIDKNKYDTYQVKYKWDIEFIVSDIGKKFRPRNLLRVEKINDYENKFFPIFKLYIQVQDILFDVIFKTQKRLVCKLTLKKIMYNDESDTSEAGGNKVMQEYIILKDTFIAFFDNIPSDTVDSSRLLTEETLDKPELIEQDEDYSIAGSTTTNVTATLWHIASLKSYKSIYNKIFADTTVGTGLGYIIQEANLIKKAIIDIPDNKIQYKELVLLPYGLRNSFISLQLRYGVYLNGMWVFLDNGTLYCLKALSVNHQHEQDKAGYTTIMLYQTPNSIHVPYVVGINKEDKSFKMETDGKLKKENLDVILGELYGDSIVYGNFDAILDSVEGNGSNVKLKNPLKSITRAKTSHKDSGIRLDLDYDELNNDFNMYALMRKNTLNMVVPIVVKGCDIDAFTPEKIVELQINDFAKNIEYGGKYCIRSVIYEFVPDKDVRNRFETNCAAHVTLSRVPDDVLSS